MALTDRDAVYGVVEAHVKARETGVQSDHRFRGDGGRRDLRSCCSPPTARRLRQSVPPADASGRTPLAERGESCALVGAATTMPRGWSRCGEGIAACWWARPIRSSWRMSLREAVRRPDVRHWRHATVVTPKNGVRKHACAGGRRATRWSVAAATEVLYHKPARRELQDVLTCLRHRVTLPTVRDAGSSPTPNMRSSRPMPSPRSSTDDRRGGGPHPRDRGALHASRWTELRYRYPAERLPDGSSDFFRVATARSR